LPRRPTAILEQSSLRLAHWALDHANPSAILFSFSFFQTLQWSRVLGNCFHLLGGIAQGMHLSDFELLQDSGKQRDAMVDTVNDFLSAPWWTRVWTVQEIVVSKHVTIVYGHDKIGEILQKAMASFNSHTSNCCQSFSESLAERERRLLSELWETCETIKDEHPHVLEECAATIFRNHPEHESFMDIFECFCGNNMPMKRSPNEADVWGATPMHMGARFTMPLGEIQTEDFFRWMQRIVPTGADFPHLNRIMDLPRPPASAISLGWHLDIAGSVCLAMRGRRSFATAHRIGLGPPVVREGDVACFLKGSRVLSIPHGRGLSAPEFVDVPTYSCSGKTATGSIKAVSSLSRFIGDCYVQGATNGQYDTSNYNDESFYLNYIISLSSPTPPLLRIRNNFLPIISVIVLNRAIRARRDIYMPRKFSMPAALPDAMARQTRFPAEVRDRVTCFRHEFETIERWSR
ncbi:hypothetical protein MPH_02994, partial [Macrophomina phaseolina MS6]